MRLNNYHSILVLFSIVFFVFACGGGEDEAPTPGTTDDDDTTGTPEFGDLNFSGSNPPSIKQIEVGETITYVVLSNGTLWQAGRDRGLADDDPSDETTSNTFIQVYEDVDIVYAVGKQTIVIKTDGSLEINDFENDPTGTWRTIDNGVKSVQTQTIMNPRMSSMISYIKDDNTLWVNEVFTLDPVVPDDFWNLSFVQIMEDVQDYAIGNSTSTNLSFSILKTDGTLLQSNGSTEWETDATIYAQVPRVGDYYRTNTGVASIAVVSEITAAIMNDGSVMVNNLFLSTNLNTEGSRYWSDVNFDRIGEFYTYPGLSDMQSIKGNGDQGLVTAWFMKSESGELYVTGYNSTGAHGDGSTPGGVNNYKSDPALVYEDVDQYDFTAGHAMLLLNSEEIKASGGNVYGQFGDGTNINKTDFDQVNAGEGDGDQALVGTWSIPDGSTMTFNSDGTGQIIQVDLTGICSDNQVPMTWTTGGSIPPGYINIDLGAFTFCGGPSDPADLAFDVAAAPATAPVAYSVSSGGGELTLNGQLWTRL